MEIKRYDTNARMSRVVVHNGVAYFCGHVASPEHQGVAAQTKALLARMEELLEQFGSDKHHMLTATIYMKDISKAPEMNQVWDAWVPEGTAPARCCVQAPLAGDEYELEIVWTAAVVREV